MDKCYKQDDTNVLRTQDIVPPYNTSINQEENLQESGAGERKEASSENELELSLEDTTSPLTSEEAKHTKNIPAEPDKLVHQGNEIPKFDLAEQIMAEQRKITAIRRKAPGKKTKALSQRPKPKSIGYNIEQPPILSEQEQIIADIVSRDIEELYRGDNWSLLR